MAELRDVMIDFETLGTVADAVILSIGAVKFDIDSDAMDDNGFYMPICVDSSLAAGRRIQADTLRWWMGQEPEAQRVFYEPASPLEVALDDFHAWFDPAMLKKYRVWSNGADFDIPMICHAWKQAGYDAPWQYWGSRCFRTLKNMPRADEADKVPNPVKHNALMDAVTQAKQAQAIMRVLTGRNKKATKA